MSDEEAAVNELEAARDRVRVRQAGRDALDLISARAAEDDETAERITLTCDLPRSVAYCAASYAAGVLLAMADLAGEPVESVLERFERRLQTVELQ